MLIFEPIKHFNRLTKYNWQQGNWRDFRYDLNGLEDMLLSFAEEAGHVSGILKALPEAGEAESIINILVAEAIKTSEIEGEYLSRTDVISSVKNNLGLSEKPLPVKDKMAGGIGKLMVSVRNTFNATLTAAVLFAWHRMLLPGQAKISTGAWRKHRMPMRVISGPIGKEKVHFEAPPSIRVPEEMQKFIQWFNNTAPGGKAEIKNAPVRSAIAHLYFESIHPFKDSNGRIGRAIAEKALSQTVGHPLLISLSHTIEGDRKSYYTALEKAQLSNEITAWIWYFVKTVVTAQKQSRELIEFTLKKSKFYDRYREKMNERQLKAIDKMLSAGPEGFKGGMTAKKFISITRASKATATRDLQLLAEMGAMTGEGAGRSTHYVLNI